MPAGMLVRPYRFAPAAPDFGGEDRAEPAPPHPNRLMCAVDPALVQQVFDVPLRQREADVLHHRDADHLRGEVLTARKRAGRCMLGG